VRCERELIWLFDHQERFVKSALLELFSISALWLCFALSFFVTCIIFGDIHEAGHTTKRRGQGLFQYHLPYLKHGDGIDNPRPWTRLQQAASNPRNGLSDGRSGAVPGGTHENLRTAPSSARR
jgi:hypothetical protein